MSTREEKIKLDVTGADQSVRDLEKVGGTAKKVGDSVSAMGREATQASKRVDDLGDEAKQTADQLNKLEREVLEAKAALKGLGDEYERSADKKVGAEFDKQAAALGKIEQRARSISKLRKEIAPKDGGGPAKAIDLGGGADRRSTVRSALADLFGILPGFGRSGAGAGASGAAGLSSLTNVGGPIISTIGTVGLGAGAAAAAVPALAAAGGAGVGLGAFGAVAGGVAGAAMQSGHVGEAFNKELDGVEARFRKATYSWVGPTIDAVHTIGDAFEGMPIEEIFKNALKYLQPLAKGVAGLASGVVGGFDALVKDAGPAVDKLANKLPKLGKDIGDSLSILGEGADGGADALGDVIDLAGDLTKVLAGAAAGAGKLYKTLENTPVFSQGHDLFKKIFDFKDMPETAARQLHGMAASEDEVADSAAAAADKVRSLNDAIEGSIGKALSSVEANLAWEKSLDDLKGGFERSKSALDSSTEAGQKNIGLVTDMVKAADDVRQAAIAQGDGSALASAKANQAYMAQIGTIEDLLVSMGVARDKAHEFLKQFLDMDGTNVTVRVNVDYQQNLPKGFSLGNLLHHAGGRTDTAPSGWAVVGEKGPELAYFNRGDRVWSNPQSQAMFGSADQARVRAASAAPASAAPASAASAYGGRGVVLPPESVLYQALAAIIVRMMQDGQLPVPASAVR